MEQNIIDPPFNYTGNKKKHISLINVVIPKEWNGNRYFESFLGSGVIFLNLMITPKHAFLNDNSEVVINTYDTLSNPHYTSSVIKYLYELEMVSTKKLYDTLCKDYFQLIDPAFAAAVYIFLKKNSYFSLCKTYTSSNGSKYLNGTYRYRHIDIDEVSSNLLRINQKLNMSKVTFSAQSYEDHIKKCKMGDFIILDPPYIFGASNYDSTIDLDIFIKAVLKLHHKGCFVLIFNSHNPVLINALKPFFKDRKTNVQTSIKNSNEIILYNYNI